MLPSVIFRPVICPTTLNFCRSHWPCGLRGLRQLACWDCGFESYLGHGCLFVVRFVCCQRSLRRADHSSRGVLLAVVRRRVWSRILVIEEALAHWGGGLSRPKQIFCFWNLQEEDFMELVSSFFFNVPVERRSE